MLKEKAHKWGDTRQCKWTSCNSLDDLSNYSSYYEIVCIFSTVFRIPRVLMKHSLNIWSLKACILNLHFWISKRKRIRVLLLFYHVLWYFWQQWGPWHHGIHGKSPLLPWPPRMSKCLDALARVGRWRSLLYGHSLGAWWFSPNFFNTIFKLSRFLLGIWEIMANV